MEEFYLHTQENKTILCISPQGIEKGGYKYNNIYQSGYFLGNIDFNNITKEEIDSIKKTTGFYEKYGSKIQPKSCISTFIKNDANDIEIIIDQEKVMLFSSKKVNLMDAELNEFLLSYKNMLQLFFTLIYYLLLSLVRKSYTIRGLFVRSLISMPCKDILLHTLIFSSNALYLLFSTY